MGTIILAFITLVFIFMSIALVVENYLKHQEKNRMILAPIGTYRTIYNDYDLRQYFVDRLGNLYSANLDTWEINKKKNRHILKCSDSSVSNGKIVNSLRDVHGKKATIPRVNLVFGILMRNNGHVEVEGEFITSRHIKVNKLVDARKEYTKTPIYVAKEA